MLSDYMRNAAKVQVVFVEQKLLERCFLCKYYDMFEKLRMTLRRDWSEDCVTCNE